MESGASSPVRSGSVQSSPSPRTTGLTYTNNPQFVEEQAIDRVHRLTQTVDVVVYKLTVRGTVEERILALQERKRLLAAQAIEGGSKKAGVKVGLQELMALFRHDHHGEPEVPETAQHDEDVDVATQRILPARSRAGGKPARSKESEIYGRRW